jgi:hypothetical protein
MVRQLGRWVLAGALALAAAQSASAQAIVPAGLGPIAAYTGLFAGSNYRPARLSSDWLLPQVAFNYGGPQVIYVPVAVTAPLPPVEPVQVTVVPVLGDGPLTEVRVKPGAVVSWSNPDHSAHNLVIDLTGLTGANADAGHHSVTIPPNGSFSLAFHQSGAFRYYRQAKPDQSASIVVSP